LIDAVESLTERGDGSRSGVEDVGELWAQQAGMGAGEEQRDAYALGSDGQRLARVSAGTSSASVFLGDEPRPVSLCGRLEASQPDTWRFVAVTRQQGAVAHDQAKS
jgi:hypothetical protein